LGVREHDMNSLQEYEAWLTTLDSKLYVKNDWLVSRLGKERRIHLSECGSYYAVLRWVLELRQSWAGDPAWLPLDYLTERFIRLINESNHLDIDAASIKGEVKELVTQQGAK
jgi:hypothetical protein